MVCCSFPSHFRLKCNSTALGRLVCLEAKEPTTTTSAKPPPAPSTSHSDEEVMLRQRRVEEKQEQPNRDETTGMWIVAAAGTACGLYIGVFSVFVTVSSAAMSLYF